MVGAHLRTLAIKGEMHHNDTNIMPQEEVVPCDFIAWYQRVWAPVAGVPDLNFVTLARYKRTGPLYMLLRDVSAMDAMGG